MAFAAGSSHGLRYIAETSFGNLPSPLNMKPLRHKSCSLVLSKDTFQSEELRSDAQIADFRHGVKKCGGDIAFELSFGEYDPFLAAALRGTWKNNVLVAGTALQTFAFEREFADIKQYEFFKGCAVNSLSLEVQTNAMITGTMNIVGKEATFAATSASTGTETSETHSPLDGFSGALKEGNATIATVTSISLQIENNIEPANVVGSDVAAALVPGRINCTGTVSAYFENLNLLNKFVNETPSSIEVTLGTGAGSYKLTLPRIKYSGGDNPVDGEGPIMLNMPFQALLDPTTGTNVKIQRVTGS